MLPFTEQFARLVVHDVPRSRQAGLPLLVIKPMKVENVGGCRIRVKLYGRERPESDRLKSQTDSTTAREQIQKARLTTVPEPADFVCESLS